MTIQEKAQHLITIHFKALGGIMHENPIIYKNTKKWEEAKACALISCVELTLPSYYTEHQLEYWHRVKDEIKKQ